MAHSNKVSPASPYLDEVRSGADEEPVRVGVAKSVGSLQIFAVGVSIKEGNWCSDFVIFFYIVLWHGSVSPTL